MALIVAFSTSSPVSSMAAFASEGGLLFSGARPSQGRASEACLELLEKSGVDPAEVELWLADLGPGSFTGTRVGVVLAKTFAWTYDRQTAGLSSFELIDPEATVALPNRKNEWLVRIPGEEPKLLPAGEIDAVGYAPGLAAEIFPEAKNFGQHLNLLQRVAPERLVPGYVVPPSISVSKKARQ